MSYYPHPRTIAYRVLDFLKYQPSDKWFTAPVIADAIDQDVSSISPCIQPCIKHELIETKRVNGLVSFRMKVEEDYPDPLRSKTSNTEPAAEPEPKPKAIAKPPKPTNKTSPEPVAPKPQEQKQVPIQHTPSPITTLGDNVVAMPNPTFRVMWCSQSGISIKKNGQVVTLNDDELLTVLKLHIHMKGGLPDIDIVDV